MQTGPAIESEYAEIYKNLSARRKALQIRMEKIREDYRTALSRDSEEQAQELENSEILNVIDRESLAELEKISRTIIAIENNKYGICAGCGSKIPSRRLEVMPHAERCVACAR